MNRGKYQHIFFDLDNTIWDFRANAFDALKVVFENLGLMSKIKSFEAFFKVYSGINDNFWRLYRAGKITKNVLKNRRFEVALDMHGCPCPGLGSVINEEFLKEMPKKTKLITGARSILDYLYPDYSLYIITNGFKNVQHCKLKNAGLSNYFKKIIISEEVGAQKPKRAIFEYALTSTNAKKNRSLMIGDSREADIEGAISFGIDQVHFLPGSVTTGKTSYSPMLHNAHRDEESVICESNKNTVTYNISSLHAIKQIL